jgi:hypothetical protein
VVIHPYTWRQTRFATNLEYPSRFLVLQDGGIVISPGRGLTRLVRRDGLLYEDAVTASGALPAALTQDADGRIVLFDAAGQRLQLRAADGALLRSLRVRPATAGVILPHALAHRHNGGWILGEPGTLRLLDDSGETASTVSVGPDGTGIPEFFRLCTDPSGSLLYLLDPRTNRVLYAPMQSSDAHIAPKARDGVLLSGLDPWCAGTVAPLQERQRLAKAQGMLLLRAAETTESLLLMHEAEERYGQAARTLTAARRLHPLDEEIPPALRRAVERRALLRNLFAAESGLDLTVEQTGVTGQGVPILAVSAQAQNLRKAFDLVLSIPGYTAEPLRIADAGPRDLPRSLPLSDWVPQLHTPVLRDHHTVRLSILVVPPGRRLPLRDEQGCEHLTLQLWVGGTEQERSSAATTTGTE